MKQVITRFLLLLTGLCTASLYAQVPPAKRTGPLRQATAKPAVLQQPATVPAAAKPVLSNPAASGFTGDNAASFSLLRFADMLVTDPDCKGPDCTYWQYTTYTTNDINTNTKNPVKNWQRMVAWKKIPAGTAAGRWEISLLPFPPGSDANFTGIIRSGITEAAESDSLNFTISYTEDAASPLLQAGAAAVQQPGQITAITKPVEVQAAPVTRGSRPGRESSLLNPALRAKFLQHADRERRFYIRIVPLDTAGKALQNISNEITLQEKFYEWKPPPPQEYLNSDYTVTAVKYVPVHFAETNYACCAVITGYNNSGNESFASAFKAAFPVGSTICPQLPKDKAWYEKAFDGVTGFVTKSVNGAADFYNETKAFLKKKFKEFNCDATGGMAIVNPVSKLQEAAGPEVCEFVSGAAFDCGMAAVGIPPSLPAADELSRIAQGQIVDIACDKIESETGLPVPDAAREKIKQGLQQQISSSADKGLVNAGFLRVKPHPQGQFRPAYLQIEVTRTGNKAQQKKGLVSFSIGDATTRTIEDWNAAEKKKTTVTLRGNLFVPSSATVPYLEKVGDKTTVYVVLKPQESYVHRSTQTGAIANVFNYPQPGEFYTPPTPTYEGFAHSLGFQLLCNKSTTVLSMGLKVAEGVNLVFENK